MSDGYTIEVSNLSPLATEKDVHDFFAFSGEVLFVELLRHGDFASTAYVTFKDLYSLETATLLSGATIVDQRVCIARWGHYPNDHNIWSSSLWGYQEDAYSMPVNEHYCRSTPQETVTRAQEVVTAMISKGYVLSKDALFKARAFDESHGVSAAAATKIAELSKSIGLTDKISAGVDVVKYADQRFQVSETTKAVAGATAKGAAAATNAIVNSGYFSAGCLWLSGALSKAAKAAAELGSHSNNK